MSRSSKRQRDESPPTPDTLSYDELWEAYEYERKHCGRYQAEVDAARPKLKAQDAEIERLKLEVQSRDEQLSKIREEWKKIHHAQNILRVDRKELDEEKKRMTDYVINRNRKSEEVEELEDGEVKDNEGEDNVAEDSEEEDEDSPDEEVDMNFICRSKFYDYKMADKFQPKRRRRHRGVIISTNHPPLKNSSDFKATAVSMNYAYTSRLGIVTTVNHGRSVDTKMGKVYDFHVGSRFKEMKKAKKVDINSINYFRANDAHEIDFPGIKTCESENFEIVISFHLNELRRQKTNGGQGRQTGHYVVIHDILNSIFVHKEFKESLDSRECVRKPNEQAARNCIRVTAVVVLMPDWLDIYRRSPNCAIFQVKDIIKTVNCDSGNLHLVKKPRFDFSKPKNSS